MTLIVSYLPTNTAFHPGQEIPGQASARNRQKSYAASRSCCSRDNLWKESADIIGKLMPIMDSIKAFVSGTEEEGAEVARQCPQASCSLPWGCQYPPEHKRAASAKKR